MEITSKTYLSLYLSRLLSLVYRGKLAVGRVKTPTLAMIVQRDMDIRLFVKETNYTVNLKLDGFSVSSKKFNDKTEAEKFAELEYEIYL